MSSGIVFYECMDTLMQAGVFMHRGKRHVDMDETIFNAAYEGIPLTLTLSPIWGFQPPMKRGEGNKSENIQISRGISVSGMKEPHSVTLAHMNGRGQKNEKKKEIKEGGGNRQYLQRIRSK